MIFAPGEQAAFYTTGAELRLRENTSACTARRTSCVPVDGAVNRKLVRLEYRCGAARNGTAHCRVCLEEEAVSRPRLLGSLP